MSQRSYAPPVGLLPTPKGVGFFLTNVPEGSTFLLDLLLASCYLLLDVGTQTGLVYSEKFTDHLTGNDHPERPERVSHVFQLLKKSDLAKKLVFLEPKPAPVKWIEEIHSPDYVKRVERTCQKGAPLIDSLDTGVCKDSYEIALLAVGAGLVLADAIVKGEIQNGFALVRPPGHHAERELALGFCLFNNVAICARYLQKEHGLKKVLIVDWDVHHGNGTQHAFEEDPTVFYFSTHQFPFYPGTGAREEEGKGKGLGTTLNIPFPRGASDVDYQKAFREIFYPRAVAFKPDFILISAGFDAHEEDPLAEISLSDDAYGMMTDVVKRIAGESCHGRIASFLEGGYNLDALSRSVYIHLKHLMA